jgi:hypothetical protein
MASEMSDASAIIELVEMAADLGALKVTVARVHPDYDSVPKGTSTLVTARELLDSLTARAEKAEADNTFARAEWAHWEAEACRIEKERKALEARLAEVELERDALAPDECSVMVRVSRDLLPKMGDWCQAVRVMVQHESDGVARLVFNDQPAREIEALRTDRDTLAGIVERVETLINDYGWRLNMGSDDVVEISTADGSALYDALSRLIDHAQLRRAALTPTREGA